MNEEDNVLCYFTRDIEHKRTGNKITAYDCHIFVFYK